LGEGRQDGSHQRQGRDCGGYALLPPRDAEASLPDIPADGCYEWKVEGKKQQPFFFGPRDGKPIAFAGLWELWEHEGVVLDTCAILTTEANELAAPATGSTDRVSLRVAALPCAVGAPRPRWRVLGLRIR
jgi:hypothetical protein